LSASRLVVRGLTLPHEAKHLFLPNPFRDRGSRRRTFLRTQSLRTTVSRCRETGFSERRLKGRERPERVREAVAETTPRSPPIWDYSARIGKSLLKRECMVGPGGLWRFCKSKGLVGSGALSEPGICGPALPKCPTICKVTQPATAESCAICKNVASLPPVVSQLREFSRTSAARYRGARAARSCCYRRSALGDLATVARLQPVAFCTSV
jgi:hypothetical protein